MKFHRYQHIEKYGTEEVDNINLGTCYLFSKLDGSNSSVWKDGDEIKAGSRNRELTLDNDNQGFYEYILQHQNLKEFLTEYPNYRLIGEWLVPHTLKTYRDNAWKKFYIFDVIEEFEDETFKYLTYEEYKLILDKFNLDYVPCMKIIKNGSYEDFVYQLNQNNFLIKDGEGIGEGIVIKNYNFVNKFHRTTWAKIVTSEFKEKHYKAMGSPETEKTMVEDQIVNEYVTITLIDKVYANISQEGWNSKRIPQLLNTVYYDLIKEETWGFIKKYKFPKIDFKILRHFTFNKVKELKSELF